jgi:hypothetical protein
MSEPEPSVERLTRFTPDAGGLDRDALLFAAGRASARPNRAWVALAAVLAAAQVLTLVLLWPRPAPPASPMPPSSPPAVLEPPPVSGERPDLLTLQRRLLESPAGDLPPPAGVDPLVESAAPLRASSAPSAVLN